MEKIEKQDCTLFFKEAHANLNKTNYAYKRGLSDDILRKFMVGYVENWKHPNAPENMILSIIMCKHSSRVEEC